MSKINFTERIENICSRAVLTSLLVFLIVGAGIFLYTLLKYKYAPDFRRDILVEAHGMALDILVIGTFIFALHKVGEKRLEKNLNIQRWQDEIDDFRFWKSEEASHRIAGNIKRLNRNGITNIDLACCCLQNIMLNHSNLKGASFLAANLQNSDFQDSNLQNANLLYADLQRAFLMRTNFQEAILEKINLKGADMRWANLIGANLESANLELSDLMEADLRNAISLTVEQLSKVKTLYQAKLDPELEKEIKEKYPHLLEKPKEEEKNKEE